MPDLPDDGSSSWRQYSFSKQELQTLRSVVEERLGIHIGPEKDYLLASRFGKMLNFNGMADGKELIASLRGMSLDTEKVLASFLTTGHTFFFREPEHFGILVKLLGNSRLQAPRIWCAASSTGEEVYSIVISLLEAGIADFSFLASDVNLEALKACRQGVYRDDRLNGVEPSLIKRYFLKGSQPGSFQINPGLSRRIILKRLNLTERFRIEHKMDIVFCRNVLIYFTPATQMKVLANIENNLAQGGYLFLGHSEPLMGSLRNLVLIAPSVYQKKLA